MFKNLIESPKLPDNYTIILYTINNNNIIVETNLQSYNR